MKGMILINEDSDVGFLVGLFVKDGEIFLKDDESIFFVKETLLEVVLEISDRAKNKEIYFEVENGTADNFRKIKDKGFTFAGHYLEMYRNEEPLTNKKLTLFRRALQELVYSSAVKLR